VTAVPKGGGGGDTPTIQKGGKCISRAAGGKVILPSVPRQARSHPSENGVFWNQIVKKRVPRAPSGGNAGRESLYLKLEYRGSRGGGKERDQREGATLKVRPAQGGETTRKVNPGRGTAPEKAGKALNFGKRASRPVDEGRGDNAA